MKDKYELLMDGIRSGVTIKELTLLYTDYMLDRNGGNKVHTAKQLGIDRRTIQRWGHNEGRAGRTKPEEPPQNEQAI